MAAVVVLLTLVAALTLALGAFARAAARRADAEGGADAAVVDAIDALLPQTQCAQCGYPGCRPYAEAVAAGADISLCPPGGDRVQTALAELLGRSPGARLPAAQTLRAKIDETRCIGCFLCVEACPVDAIVGAPKLMHTVLEQRCTGCELCLPPCPVDCIDLLPVATAAGSAGEVNPVRAGGDATDAAAPCIRCHRCEPVCPEALAPAHLWWLARDEVPEAARSAGLDACIECGLCNAACPSGIDLVATFRGAKARLKEHARLRAEAERARDLHQQHEDRLARERLIATDRRKKRLARRRQPAEGP